MIVEQFEQTKKEIFIRLVNHLQKENVIYQKIIKENGLKLEYNPDYAFLMENFQAFYQYFSYGGWELVEEGHYNIRMVYLKNLMGNNHAQLYKVESALLFVFRVFFEEQRKQLRDSADVIVSMADVKERLQNVYQIFENLPNSTRFEEAIRTLCRMNVIRKCKQDQVMILPYIACVLSDDKIHRLANLLLQDQEGGEEDETETSVVE